MKYNYPQPTLVFLEKHEGGSVHHKLDPGGATNCGITLAAYRNHVGREASKGELFSLTWGSSHVCHIYRKYWNAVKAYALPSGLDYLTFDAAVNSGQKRAAKFLQKALNVKADGVIGSKTIRAAEGAVNFGRGEDVIRDAIMYRMIHWSNLQRVFRKGWFRRGLEVYRAAIDMHRRSLTN